MSTCNILRKLKNTLYTAARAIPGLLMIASRAGSTFFIVQEFNNYVFKQDNPIQDNWGMMLALVACETGVVVTTFATRFIVMVMKSNNPDIITIAATEVSIQNPRRVSWCKNFFNPDSLQTESYQAGFISIQLFTVAFAGQVILHSSLSADSYFSGNNIPANISFLAFCWANLRGLTKYTFPQNAVFFKDIVLDKGYKDLTFGEYFKTIISSILFGVNVFFTVNPSLKAFEKNTLATVTTQFADVTTTFGIASVLVLSAFINNMVIVLSAYYREKQPVHLRTHVNALSAPLRTFINFNIWLNAGYFAVNTYNSFATLPSTLQNVQYNPLNYHPGIIAGATVAAGINAAATLVSDFRARSYMEELLHAKRTRQPRNTSLNTPGSPSLFNHSEANEQLLTEVNEPLTLRHDSPSIA